MLDENTMTLPQVTEVFHCTETYLFRRSICDLPTNALIPLPHRSKMLGHDMLNGVCTLIAVAVHVLVLRRPEVLKALQHIELVLAEDEAELTGRQIARFSFKNAEQPVTSWVEMYLKVIQILYAEDKSVITKLAVSSENDIAYHFTTNSSTFTKSMAVGDGIYVWTNTNTQNKLSVLSRLFTLYHVSPAELVFYLRDETETAEDAPGSRQELRPCYIGNNHIIKPLYPIAVKLSHLPPVNLIFNADVWEPQIDFGRGLVFTLIPHKGRAQRGLNVGPAGQYLVIRRLSSWMCGSRTSTTAVTFPMRSCCRWEPSTRTPPPRSSPRRIQQFWYIAAVETAARRPPPLWRRWAIPTSANSAASKRAESGLQGVQQGGGTSSA